MLRIRAFAATVLFLSLQGPLLSAQEESPPEAEPEPRGLRAREEGAFDGLTLVAPLQSKAIYLVDMSGEVVHTWQTEHAPGGGIYLLGNGNLLCCARQDENPRFHGGGIGGRVRELDWDGTVVWDYELANDYQTQHHDLEPLPNGNVLMIVWEHRYTEDVIAAGRDPAAVGAEGLWPDAVLEVRPERPAGGEVVWEWHVWDHVIQDFDAEKAEYGSIPDHPELVDLNADHRDRPPLSAEERKRLEEVEKQMRALGYIGGEEDQAPAPDEERGPDPDWLHTNAVHYCPELDLIALSVPHLNEIWILDHSTTSEEAAWHSGGRYGKGGDLLYRWGNPRTYGAGGDGERRLFYQHDVQFLPVAKEGELRVTLFNNGGGRPGGEHSSVEELVLPFDRERGFTRERGKAFGPPEPAWSYSDPEHFFSGFISGAQRLPNGNTLICEGAEGRIFEVTREGRIVWDYLNPFGGEVRPTSQSGAPPPKALFRATRIARDHPELGGRF